MAKRRFRHHAFVSCPGCTREAISFHVEPLPDQSPLYLACAWCERIWSYSYARNEWHKIGTTPDELIQDVLDELTSPYGG